MKPIITAILILHGICLFSQSSIELTIIDKEQNSISFHPVIVKNIEIGYEKSAITDINGKIQLDGLSTSGQYEIVIPESGFYQGAMLTNISLISENTKSITLVIQEKSQGLDAIVVTAEGSYQSINAINAEVASELKSEELERLPVEGRDITRALYRLPNIVQATGFFPEAPIVAINGANALYTHYQIDGMDNNENFLGGQRFNMPTGFTENITVLTNNFSAQHGLTSNGIVNITSKSGTNELTGEAFYITRPGPTIDAPSAFAQRDLSGNQVKDGFQRHQFGFGIGGAVIKDKTFYFINAEHTSDIKDNLLNVPQLGINETVRGNNAFSYLSAKIDQHWSQQFRTSLRMNIGNSRIERQGGGLEGGEAFPSAANTQTRKAINVALKNTYIGKGFTYEGNYLYGQFDWNYANPENSSSPNVNVLDPQGLSMAALGHPGFVFEDIEHTHVVQQNLTFYENNHRIKTGLQLKFSNFDLFGGGNPNGTYTVQLNESQLEQLRAQGKGSQLQPMDIPSDAEVLFYGIELRPNAFTHSQNIYSIFIEDQWTLSPRLNLNLGLRYDYDDLSKGGNDQGDLNNIAPRLSANYKFNSQTSIRAGYGIYYDKILYAVHSDARQFSSNSEDYKRQIQTFINQGILPADTDIEAVTNEGNLVASAPNVQYLEGLDPSQLESQREDVFQNELRILNPEGYDNPYSHQFMMGIQHKIDDDRLFFVDFMHNRSHNLFRLRNLNAPAANAVDPENVTVRGSSEADLTRPVPIFEDDFGNYTLIEGDTLRGISRNVMMTESAGRSNYYAMNMTFQKARGTDNYALRLMYTLSFLENNTEDINFRAMDANDFDAEWGPSINDRTHLINGIFTYYPLNNLNITIAGLLQSGQPINRIPDASIYGTSDLNGDGRGFGDAYVGNSDRSPGETRNSDRLPWSTTFDLSAFYTIKAGVSKIEIGAQIFNIFDAENLSGYANNATQSNQIQVGAASSGVLIKRNAAPPRQFQFSLRYLF